ncbi:hypothetical protein BN946_scf185002.g125 [Trametes cinnabarina]|uniref:Inositol polyphosphate-related phosphatase domain-containing protein n=1 Tax=Pycnoporus cinnabarinus TaxID=5643 RepID=A0A060SEZ0_PYCCI|nr:hypothetical protein BN946_scf185002.g125 [Trametes cinnabarina]
MSADNARPLVQIASYNTNLQAERGLPQDLVDWLAPTLQVSSFLARERRAPDIVAVGFQELLPLHLGLSGLSNPVLESRNALILSQIEKHAPNNERYTLIAKVVNVGVALLVYGRDDGVGQRACDRIRDYHHIVGTLLFPPRSSSSADSTPSGPTTMFDTRYQRRKGAWR